MVVTHAIKRNQNVKFKAIPFTSVWYPAYRMFTQSHEPEPWLMALVHISQPLLVNLFKKCLSFSYNCYFPAKLYFRHYWMILISTLQLSLYSSLKFYHFYLTMGNCCFLIDSVIAVHNLHFTVLYIALLFWWYRHKTVLQITSDTRKHATCS